MCIYKMPLHKVLHQLLSLNVLDIKFATRGNLKRSTRMAIRHGYVESIKAVNIGAALNIAAKYGNLEFIRANASRENLRAVLFKAAKHGKLNILHEYKDELRAMVENHQEISMILSSRWCSQSLIAAVDYNDVPAVKFHTRSAGYYDDYGRTRCAIKLNDISVLERFIVNYDYALKVAVVGGEMKCFNWLVEHTQITVAHLQECAANGTAEKLDILMKLVDLQDDDGTSLIAFAAYAGNVSTFTYLIDLGHEPRIMRHLTPQCILRLLGKKM
jgi:hypothetical protein